MASLVLRLPRAALARRDVVTRLAADQNERSLFALKCDELAFARALLERRPNFWLYRTSQRAFAGDFAIVDVSSPQPEKRRVLAVELKRGEPARAASISAIQLSRTPAVVDALAQTGIVTKSAPIDAVLGDARAVLAFLRVPSRNGSGGDEDLLLPSR